MCRDCTWSEVQIMHMDYVHYLHPFIYIRVSRYPITDKTQPVRENVKGRTYSFDSAVKGVGLKAFSLTGKVL